MKTVIERLNTLSGQEKREYMQEISFQIAKILTDKWKDIVTNISEAIINLLGSTNEKEYKDSIIIIKPLTANETLYTVKVFDLITHICYQLNIAILDIKEMKISSNIIDVIYHWKNLDKKNPVYTQLCQYFESWNSIILKVNGTLIDEKLMLMKTFIRLLNIAKHWWTYDFIHNILHTPESNEININFKALWYKIEWKENISD